jgi:hypothetical protein
MGYICESDAEGESMCRETYEQTLEKMEFYLVVILVGLA